MKRERNKREAEVMTDKEMKRGEVETDGEGWVRMDLFHSALFRPTSRSLWICLD